MDAIWILKDKDGLALRAYSSKDRADEDLDLCNEGYGTQEVCFYGTGPGFQVRHSPGVQEVAELGRLVGRTSGFMPE